MLEELSGKTHRVISGVCLLRMPGGRCLTAAETTRVRFRPLGRAEIEAYLDTPEPYDKAGAYVCMEAFRRLSKEKKLAARVVSVATTQEEIGTRGAQVSAQGINPQVAIAGLLGLFL